MTESQTEDERKKERKRRRKERKELKKQREKELNEKEAEAQKPVARDPRAKRETSTREDVTELSGLQRFSVLTIESNPYIYISLQILVALSEAAACLLYFLALQFPPEGETYIGELEGFPGVNTTLLKDPTIYSYPYRDQYLIAFGILGMYFIAQFFLFFLVSDNRYGLLLSVDMFVFLTTALPMLGMFIHAQAFDVNRTIWAPIFLRSWSAWKATAKMIRHFNFSSAVKEITVESAFLLCILINSAGVYQVCELMDRGKFVGFDSTIYMVVVTISTMGYGEDEIIPTSRYTFIAVIVIIFVAMIYLPVMINKFTELAEYLRRRNTYSKSLPHVVVVGKFAASEVRLLFGEFMAGSRKFTPLNLVLVSPEPFELDIMTLIAEPAYRSRVTLCVSTSHDNDELTRFRARKANALFIMSSRSAIAERGDYDALIKSIAFFRHDRDLPQYLTLKRGAHTKVAKRTARMVFERERLKFSVMGMALQLPGFIPMLFNLIKTFEKAPMTAEEEKLHAKCRPWEIGWFEEYQSGMLNSIHTVQVPDSLIGRHFKSASLILLIRVEMTVIGVIKAETTEVELVPSDQYQLQEGDQMVVISRATDAEARMETLSKNKKDDDENHPASRKNPPPTSRMHGEGEDGVAGGEVAPSFEEMIAPLVPGTELIRPTKSTKKKSSFPFTDHVVLIDLSCFQHPADLCAEEERRQMEFQKTDLVHLLQPFFADRTQQIVWLSRDDPGEPLQEDWPKHMRPMYHVRGAGTDPTMLEKCNIAAAKAILIFTSLEGDSAAGDASLMLVQRMVHDRLREAGKEKTTPVLIEVDDYGCLNHCKPRFMSDVAAEKNLNAEEYFTAPVFVVGGAISSAMLDTLMYQTYYNKWIPTVVEQLLYTPFAAKVVANLHVKEIVPSLNAMSAEPVYYADLFRQLSHLNMVPLGLYRKISSDEMGANLNGFSYFVTNPEAGTILRADDCVYVIQNKS